MKNKTYRGTKKNKSDFYQVLVIQNFVSLYHYGYLIYPDVDRELLNKIFTTIC